MKIKSYLQLLVSSVVAVMAFSSHARDLNIVSFNLEAQGSSIHVLAHQLEDLSAQREVDIWLFSDINADWSDELANAVAAGSNHDIDFAPRDAGKSNRFLAVFNRER